MKKAIYKARKIPNFAADAGGAGKKGRVRMLWRLIKLLVLLIVLAAIGLIGYAYVGPLFGSDFSAPQDEVVIPLEFPLD